jgi:UDP-N-acetyl-D-galactosamine dehydrogenase
MKEKKIAVLGLGYVGLPLAVVLSSSYKVIGFDISSSRVRQLKKGFDFTFEVDSQKLKNCQKKNLIITNNIKPLSGCNIYIATVPTPIDKKKKPDFSAILSVCKTIGKLLKKEDIVVFESTVHPGATEEICGPELEKYTNGLQSGRDFFLGYSPERVNPGDKVHTIDKINKVISAQNKNVEKILYEIYSKLTNGEVFIAKNIRVAEASKVIENSQRDINIAFINEITKICQKIGISIFDVLDASSTKWNFLKFQPGLVGGHCIGVDPYYLAAKAKELKINPQVILSGRSTNDNMTDFIGNKINKKLKRNSRILFLGITFKENVPDLRNSKAIDLMCFFQKKRHKVVFNDLYIEKFQNYKFDAIVLCVPHRFYLCKGEKVLLKFLKSEGYFFDIKGSFRDKKIKNYWTL